MGISMPRWHALSSDHFADHQTETTHHVVVGHRPGAYATFAMTAHTVLIQHGCDGLCVGNGFVFGTAGQLWEIHRAVGIRASVGNRCHPITLNQLSHCLPCTLHVAPVGQGPRPGVDH